MRIAVCIKQVFDPATIKVSRTRQAIDDRGARKILNPSDRWALDAALRFKELDWHRDRGNDYRRRRCRGYPA